MEVETNGSVEAEDCVAYAARILQDQLGMFINFEEQKKQLLNRQNLNQNLIKIY